MAMSSVLGPFFAAFFAVLRGVFATGAEFNAGSTDVLADSGARGVAVFFAVVLAAFFAGISLDYGKLRTVT